MFQIATKMINEQTATISFPSKGLLWLADLNNTEEVSHTEHFIKNIIPIVSNPSDYSDIFDEINIDYNKFSKFNLFVTILTMDKENYEKSIGEILSINGYPFNSFELCKNNKDDSILLINLSHKEQDGKYECLTESIFDFLLESLSKEYVRYGE